MSATRSPVILLAVLALATSSIGATALAARPSGEPTELWNQFPLDPAAGPASSTDLATTPTPIAPAPVAPAPVGPASVAKPAGDAGGRISPQAVVLTLLGALAGLIGVIFAARSVRGRRGSGAIEAAPAVDLPTADVEFASVQPEPADPEDGALVAHDPVATPQAPLPRVERGDLAANVVEVLREGLDAGRLTLLGEAWAFRYGASTGADTWNGTIDRRLNASSREQLLAAGCQPGDPVLLLPPGDESRAPWRDHPEVLVSTALPDGILFGYVDPQRLASIVAPHPDNLPAPVLAYLERWRPLLERRTDRSRGTQAPWWEPSRRPTAAILSTPKLIIARRARKGRVAIDHDGAIYGDSRSVLGMPRSGSTRLDWGCALLASETVALWLQGTEAVGKPGEMRLRDVGRLAAIPQPETIRANISDLVAELSANRRALSLFVDTAPGLRDILADPWVTSVPPTDARRLIETLSAAERISLRESPAITILGDPDFDRELFALQQTDGSLGLRDGRRIVGGINGDGQVTRLLSVLLTRPRRLTEVRVPRDMDAFFDRIGRREAMMRNLLATGLELAEAIEREVAHALGLSEELIEQIVEQARGEGARSDTSAPPEITSAGARDAVSGPRA